MKRQNLRSLVCLAATLLLLSGANVAQASPTARTRGDAQAVFEAGFTGGTNILLLHNAEANGAPAQLGSEDPEAVRFYPFLDGAAYCASGWHVVDFNVGDDLVYYDSRQELAQSLALREMFYELDGTPLRTQRTATKEGLGFENGRGLWVGIGAFLPPGTLTVGDHELKTTYIDSDNEFEFEVVIEVKVLAC